MSRKSCAELVLHLVISFMALEGTVFDVRDANALFAGLPLIVMIFTPPNFHRGSIQEYNVWKP